MLKKIMNRVFEMSNIAKNNVTKRCSIKYSCKISLTSSFEGRNVIHRSTIISNSRIGFATFIGSSSFFVNTNIGRYCSIGNSVSVICGKHPTSTFVSTHPSFFSLLKQSGFTYVEKQLFNENSYLDLEKKINLIIGNDVWIGEGVKIIEGNTIGNGVIVGTGAVVTKNLEPYCIYAGVPARKIGQRFTDEQIEILEQIKWWEKDQVWISENANKFTSIDSFIDFIKNEEKSS